MLKDIKGMLSGMLSSTSNTSKKAVYNLFFYENWPELFAIILLFIGAIIALASGSALMSYIIIFISGMISGKAWWDHRKNYKLGLSLMIFGFLIGFTIGAIYGKKLLIFLFFIAGNLIGYHILDRGLIKH